MVRMGDSTRPWYQGDDNCNSAGVSWNRGMEPPGRSRRRAGSYVKPGCSGTRILQTTEFTNRRASHRVCGESVQTVQGGMGEGGKGVDGNTLFRKPQNGIGFNGIADANDRV